MFTNFSITTLLGSDENIMLKFYLPYKQKIWLEKYLAKSATNHFDEIKFGGSRVPMYNKIALNLRLAN